MSAPTNRPYVEVLLGGEIRVVFPASVLDEGTQAAIDQLAARFPPEQAAAAAVELEDATGCFSQEELDQMADWAANPYAAPFPLEEGSQFTAAAPSAAVDADAFSSSPPPPHLTSTMPASSSPGAAVTTTTTSSSPPGALFSAAINPAAARHHQRRKPRNPRRQTPPGFPGYRWEAQALALRGPTAPCVQLGAVYAHLQAKYAGWFADSAGSASWKSGVRHAVRAHFRRVEGGGAGEGVWYTPDPDNLMQRGEAERIAGGGR